MGRQGRGEAMGRVRKGGRMVGYIGYGKGRMGREGAIGWFRSDYGK